MDRDRKDDIRDAVSDDEIRQFVRESYSRIADSGGPCCSGGTCCEPGIVQGISERLGYSNREISCAPEGSNLGLGCGNPLAFAALKPGERVVDLGSGGGFDAFLAADQVGEQGWVIGVDMTPAMISKARANASKAGRHNVEFRLGEIEHLPVADNSVDVVISNCVINLSPDKQQVFSDIFRVLKDGGRLAITDIVAIRGLPPELRQNRQAYCGCAAGAVQVQEIEQMLKVAGFTDIEITLREESREFIRDWFPGEGFEEYVRSALITAGKRS
ncbi:MAG: arsenite methyltransferase [Pseudomonadota bacterium]|jgi:arsenite methyltransferase|nr:arsenite methyltransferase [Pseudomonadota bacterium]HON39422.1 arsenite methyltransferase [Deltaproteobacteria bacterium]HPD22537.1 arsenite methyltransferase [Deltaproteobacteria bacterium]HRS57498.1 arsenite methyltransferase [Desulfomonilia bacterium]HRV36800.1 arsenite methyltransferase [Desulfomonilia bacterium]